MSGSQTTINAGTSPISVTLDELLEYRRLARAVMQSKNRQVVSEQQGDMQSRMLGRGLDFSELREYQPGDDIRQIDWNVTARTGKPHTKLFRLERERPCFIVVDLRVSMFFATRVAYKSVLAARLAAVLAWAAVSANDRVGGLVFTDKRHIEIKPEGGRRGIMRLFRAILQGFSEQTEEPVASTAFSDAATRLSRLAHTGSTIWFCSDFAGFNQVARSQFAGLMQHNELNALQIADSMEAQLPPPGDYLLRSGKGELRVNTRGGVARQQYEDQFKDGQQQLRHFFSWGRHSFRCIYTHDDLATKAAEALRRLPELTGGEHDG